MTQMSQSCADKQMVRWPWYKYRP